MMTSSIVDSMLSPSLLDAHKVIWWCLSILQHAKDYTKLLGTRNSEYSLNWTIIKREFMLFSGISVKWTPTTSAWIWTTFTDSILCDIKCQTKLIISKLLLHWLSFDYPGFFSLKVIHRTIREQGVFCPRLCFLLGLRTKKKITLDLLTWGVWFL